MRILAEFADYHGLILALRARASDRRLALSSDALAQVSGLPDRYIPKVLGLVDASPPSLRRSRDPRYLGPISMGPVLAVLGVKLLLVEDPQTAPIMLNRLDERSPNGRSLADQFQQPFGPERDGL